VLLWKTYGEIYQVDIGGPCVLVRCMSSSDILSTLGRRMVMINTYELLAEIYDEKRFHKIVAGPLGELREHLIGDALFTAQTGEKNWGLARS
jgi:hypothetical protein